MMDRRRLLLGAVSLLTGGTALLSLSCDGDPVTDVRLRLGGLLSKDALRIGRLWLDRHPGESDQLKLTERILGDAPVDSRLGAAVAARIAADYAEGRTDPLEGWVLSETAARLCALAWLTR